VASYVATFGSTGAHSLTARYSGDATFLDSTSNTLSLNVFPQPKITLTASPSPVQVLQPISFKVTVAGNVPTGSVTLKDGATTLESKPLASGIATFSATFTSLGAHNMTVVYSGDANNPAMTSTPFAILVNPPGFTNVALAANGGVASASSTYSFHYPVEAVNNNERSGKNYETGGGVWLDGTQYIRPDWLQINFNGKKTVSSLILYSMQEKSPPDEPDDGMTFSSNGSGTIDFTVKGWNGTAWVTLATVTGNSLVKRAVTFAPFDTDRIRIDITNTARADFCYVTELEVFGMPYVAPVATTTTLSTIPLRVGLNKEVTLTATVTGNFPSGTVTFYDGATSLGAPVELVNGSASFSSASLSTILTTPGLHTIKADYGGDRNNFASSVTSQVQVTGPSMVPLLMLLLDE
ncbi:MAG: Ig-like domain-containing protein, partial [Pseudomonadota bacterium]